MKRILATLLFVATCVPAAHAAMEDDVRKLQGDWANIKYVAPKADQEKSFEALTQAAAAVRERYPTRAEPMIWYGIIAASYAGAKGGLGALSIVMDA